MQTIARPSGSGPQLITSVFDYAAFTTQHAWPRWTRCELLSHSTWSRLRPSRLAHHRCSHDDHDILDGVEQFISAASTSDRYVVMARTGVAGPKGVLAFVVEKCIPGVRFGKECKVGRHGQSTAQVIFEGVRVPAENLLVDSTANLLAGQRPKRSRGVPSELAGTLGDADKDS